MNRLFAGFALASFLSTPVAPADVFVAELLFPSAIEEWFEQEMARLEKMCPDRECWGRELERRTWIVNAARSSPDANSPHVGDVVVATGHTEGWPHLRFDYQPLGGPPVVWLDADAIGDWGYGIHVVVRGKGEAAQGDHPVWIQLGGVPGPAWVEMKPFRVNESPRVLIGELRPITESVLKVDGGIPAVNRRTGSRMLLPTRHNYLVERVSRTHAFFRQEVGADMPCREGEETDLPTAATPRYRVAIESLFRRDGRPLLSIAYPRGC